MRRSDDGPECRSGAEPFTGGGVSFWEALDALVEGAEIVVDRPRGSRHPDFPEFVYELDYGYLKGTTSADGEGIDVWIGSDSRRRRDRRMDRKRFPTAGDGRALHGRFIEARRRIENSRRLHGRRLRRDPAVLPHAALACADSAARVSPNHRFEMREGPAKFGFRCNCGSEERVFRGIADGDFQSMQAGDLRPDQRIFCSISSSAQPSGVRRHWLLRPQTANPAWRKRERLAVLSGVTLHHS